MSLKSFQDLLLRVYTEDRFRKEFLRHPEAVLGRYRLSPTEAGALRAIRKAELERFCDSLAIKRWSRLRAYFPKTASLLGKSFSSLLLEFSDRHADVRDWPERVACFYRLLQSQFHGRKDLPPPAQERAAGEYAEAMRKARRAVPR